MMRAQSTLMFVIVVLVAGSLVAQATRPQERDKATADARLQFMKTAVAGYKVSLVDSAGTVLKLTTEPAFRLGNQPADNLVDGAVFFWTGAGGKPEAAIQVYQKKDRSYPEGVWVHDFTSLAASPVRAERDGASIWKPSGPGVEYKPIPDAPKPAQTAAQRTRQLNQLAQGFRASDAFKQKGWSELRLLPKPIVRYGSEKSDVLDGALFAFVMGTDTEVFLLLEARSVSGRYVWQYALAPMTVFALKCSYDGRTVWELPDRLPAEDPTKPYFYTNINR